MKQDIEYIKISELVLWTENPRDPIDSKAKDQEVVDRAFLDKMAKWNLSKLAKNMGAFYDFSELPTVVYHRRKPVVYDGNRRIVLGKVKHGLVTIPKKINFPIPDFPDKIPCNVCDKKTALENVLRKHGESGSWTPLDRDIFLHKFMGHKKSEFLVLEEETKIISENPQINKRFVKEEVFDADSLTKLGFTVKNGRVHSVHSNPEGYDILNDLKSKIVSKAISTRNSRGKVIEVLQPKNQRTISKNKNKKTHLAKISFKKPTTPKKGKVTPRTRKKAKEIFGSKLFLKQGETSNIYRDIVDLYTYYNKQKDKLSESFPSLIRMSLRLLCESAAKDKKTKLDNYLKNNFEKAKKELDSNTKTLLSNQNVSKASIMQLIHTGAHNYTSSNNLEQTIAMSIIIGNILTLTHGKSEK